MFFLIAITTLRYFKDLDFPLVIVILERFPTTAVASVAEVAGTGSSVAIVAVDSG